MDGTLIDESDSYREAIRLTAELCLGRPVDAGEVDEIKRLPGFNNDLDATWALVTSDRQGEIRQPNAEERQDVTYRHIENVFQTHYLGHELWARVSGMEPPFVWTEPLIWRETPLVTVETLERLNGFMLGIATSRPRMEAMMALQQHDLTRFFPREVVICSEDAPFEKPHPAPLLELTRRLGCRSPVYVGDTINDAIAAAGAGMPFVQIGYEPLSDPAVPVQARIASVQELPGLIGEGIPGAIGTSRVI